MTYLKMLSPALVAGISATALLGAGSASANIDLCLLKSGQTPKALTHAECLALGGTAHNLLEEKVVVEALAEGPILKGALNQNCEHSAMTLEANGDKTLKGKITALSFTGSCKPCTTVTTSPPYETSLGMEGEAYFLKWNGSFKLSGCPFGVTCKFGGTGIKLDLLLNKETLMHAFEGKEETLTLEEGSKLVCGSTSKWTTNYKLINSALYSYFYLL